MGIHFSGTCVFYLIFPLVIYIFSESGCHLHREKLARDARKNEAVPCEIPASWEGEVERQ